MSCLQFVSTVIFITNAVLQVRPYLLSKNWETRTAAGLALEAIANRTADFETVVAEAGTALT